MTTWLQQRAGVLGLSSQTTHALQLCLEEAVTNVISYAFDAGSAHDVQIRLWHEGDALLAEVTDDGRPFDPVAYQAVPIAKHLDAVAVGGLGIKLMHGFAQHIAYRRSGSTNHLLLSFPAI